MVWALYAYFSDFKLAAFSLWSDACSISAIGETNDKSQLAKIFSKFLRTRKIWPVEKSLKFHDNEK